MHFSTALLRRNLDMKNNIVKIERNDNDDERTILSLADEMAASTATLNHHTYTVFIEAREMLKKKVREVCNKNKLNENL